MKNDENLSKKYEWLNGIRVPQFDDDLQGEKLINTVAREAYFSADEDPEAASALMQSWIFADEKLRERIVDPIINLTCRQSLDAIVRATRPGMRAGATEPSETLLTGIRKAAQRDLMQFPVKINGQWSRLGLCQKSDLLPLAEEREKSARTLKQDAKWFRLIAAELKSEQRVEDALKNADLEQLQKKARQGVA